MSQNIDNSESQKIVLIKERYCFIIYFNAPPQAIIGRRIRKRKRQYPDVARCNDH